MILITGGARSGKSHLAEQRVKQIAQDNQKQVLYIATSLIFDKEMAKRVEKHKKMRPDYWQTYEGHRDLGKLIQQKNTEYGVILLECITTMLTNLLFDETGDLSPELMDFVAIEESLNNQIDQLIEGCRISQCEIVIVTNELGLGIVPENRLARHFRDIAGRANQRLAQQATEVHFVVSGIDMKIKG